MGALTAVRRGQGGSEALASVWVATVGKTVTMTLNVAMAVDEELDSNPSETVF